jgi:hypothetical protein
MAACQQYGTVRSSTSTVADSNPYNAAAAAESNKSVRWQVLQWWLQHKTRLQGAAMRSD